MNEGFVPLKIRIAHQEKNRAKAREDAEKEGMSVGEYLTKEVGLNKNFCIFATYILDLEYDEEPNYDYLISL